MTQRNALYGSTAALLALMAGAAQADVTASDVWSNMSGFYGLGGYEVTPGSLDESGGAVSITDLRIGFPNPSAGMQAGIEIDIFATLPSMRLEEVGDGTVRVILPDSYAVLMEITPSGEETGTVGMTVSQPGMTLVASGAPDAVTYTISAPEVTATVDRIEIPGEGQVTDAVNATLRMGTLAASYTLATSGEMPTLNMDLSAASTGLNIDVQEPGGPGSLVAAFDYSGLTWTGASTLAQGTTPGDLTGMLRAGFTSDTTIAHQGATYSFQFNDQGDSMDVQGSAGSGAADVDMTAEGMRYLISNTAMALKVAGSQIPLPEIALEAEKTAFGLTMPVLANETPQDLGLQLRLEGLSVSDMIWGLIDPGAALPRDPATLIIDLAGKANWLIDIMDPMAMVEFQGGLPGGLHQLTANEITLAIAGAEVNASGAFDIDMENMSTFPGAPAPTGALDIKLTGANGLMDRLVGMGLLPQDQAMGARMMLGLFAQPGEGPDTLVTKIEVDGATGAVSANGQRLQ